MIEAYAARMPERDERWVPRPCTRAELARALMEGGVAGTATHPLDNVRGNILMLMEGDPDKQFGPLGACPGAFGFDDILDLVAAGAGVPIDHEARYGVVRHRARPRSSTPARRWASGSPRPRANGERVILATGHPIGLGLVLSRARRAADGARRRVLDPGAGGRPGGTGPSPA